MAAREAVCEELFLKNGVAEVARAIAGDDLLYNVTEHDSRNEFGEEKREDVLAQLLGEQ